MLNPSLSQWSRDANWNKHDKEWEEHDWAFSSFERQAYQSVQFSSVVQSCPTLCDPHGLKHTRLPCSSSTPRACSNLCPSSRWCHPTTSYSVVPFSSRLQSFPASWSFPRSQFFTSGGQNWGFSFNISPSNKYSGLITFRMDWLDLLAFQWTLKSLLQHHSSKASILWHSAL